jgi:hypothetical protein
MLSEILTAYPWYDHPEGLKFVETHRDAHRTSGHWLLLLGKFSTFHKWVGGDELVDPCGATAPSRSRAVWRALPVVTLGTDVSKERPAAVASRGRM